MNEFPGRQICNWCGFMVVMTSLGVMPVLRAGAQVSDGPVQIFGYYQNAFQYYARVNDRDSNSFLLQQLNFIAQKDLAPKFRSFVNFEFINTFESSLRWGAASLKEAWVRYDLDPRLRFKLGLQIPIFNHLNEIKTGTPLLPYIVRPVAYETSLKEIISLEEYTPERAFVQAYGSLSGRMLSFDYALYLGNTPNVNDDLERGQTGVDTTSIMLGGGRLGLRMNNVESDFSEIRLGVSATYDRINFYDDVKSYIPPDPKESLRSILDNMPRWRLGADLGLYWKQFYIQSEVIALRYLEQEEASLLERSFYYGTLGATLSDRLETYLTYWRVHERGVLDVAREDLSFYLEQEVNLNIYSLGCKINITPRLVFKAQYAYLDLASVDVLPDLNTLTGASILDFDETFSIYTIALSVFF